MESLCVTIMPMNACALCHCVTICSFISELKCSKLNQLTKFILPTTLIRPVIVYGGETWSVGRSAILELLDIFQTK